jgi:hypothetical protein
MLRRSLIGGLLVLASAGTPTPLHAGVDIGIHISAPPVLVPVPSSPVRYAPSLPANYFAYDGRFFVYDGGAWYAGPAYDGPWTAVSIDVLPPPLLAVPVRYYRARPPAWRHWELRRAPHWHDHHGHGKHGHGKHGHGKHGHGKGRH